MFSIAPPEAAGRPFSPSWRLDLDDFLVGMATALLLRARAHRLPLSPSPGVLRALLPMEPGPAGHSAKAPCLPARKGDGAVTARFRLRGGRDISPPANGRPFRRCGRLPVNLPSRAGVHEPRKRRKTCAHSKRRRPLADGLPQHLCSSHSCSSLSAWPPAGRVRARRHPRAPARARRPPARP